MPSALPSVVTWEPQPKQHTLISCPIEDVLFGGARGGGKTDGLLGDFLSHADRYPQHARGIFFRRSYPELEEVEARAQEIYPATGAKWSASKRTWTWPKGAFLRMRYFERETDHTLYQGRSNSWLGFDEVTNWANPNGLDKLRATLRSAHGVPCYVRCSGNPGGVGHSWVKARYVDPAPAMQPFATTETVGADTVTVKRVYIPSTLDDNYILRLKDPNYWQRIVLAAGGREDILKAWRYGLWNIVAGGYFDDLWRDAIHSVEPFNIPASWSIRRAFDWGSSDPFSVGWWAHSDGAAPAPNGRVYPKSTRFRIMELYGWNGKPNEGLRLTNSDIARRIKAMEDDSPYKGRVRPGPADSQIFDVVNGLSIADDMASHGIRWTKAQKGPGSRRQGWQLLRRMLQAGMQWPMEESGLFVFNTCRQFLRTFPVLPRDPMDPDDVDSSSEDHCFAGDTLVETTAGSLSIAELVGQTGWVHTDKGPYQFTRCRQMPQQEKVVLVVFGNGRKVTCTPDHLFLTIDRRWVKAEDLTDEICYNISNTQEDICALSSSVKPSKNLMVNDFISPDPTFSTRVAAYIKWCGLTSVVTFLMVLKFIIQHMIARKIRLKTLSYFRAGDTINTMLPLRILENGGGASWNKPERLLAFGMALQRGLHGIKNNMSGFVLRRCYNIQKWLAQSAVAFFRQYGEDRFIPFVPTNVNLLFGASKELMMCSALAPFVVEHSLSTATSNKRLADMPVVGSRVVSVKPAGVADVYCLKVPRLHRFAIEGGLIVHNCGDETRYECTMPFQWEVNVVNVLGY